MWNFFVVGFMAFLAGAVVGIVWKALIDRKYNKRIGAELVSVAQMADDEIEALQLENERLLATVTDLQVQLAKRRQV